MPATRMGGTPNVTISYDEGIVVPLLIALAIQQGNPLTDPYKPWIRRFGSYEVVCYGKEQPDYCNTLYLKDRKGRVVTKIQAFRVSLRVDDSNRLACYQDVDGDGVPELILYSWTGGAYASMRYYVWSLGRRPRCLLDYDKNQVGDSDDFDFVDLDHDGASEIKTSYDGFSCFFWGPQSNGSFPTHLKPVPLVLKLKNGRYVDESAAFPHRWREGLIGAEKDVERSRSDESWMSPRAAALRCYALAYLLGDPEEGQRFVKKHSTPGIYSRLLVLRPKIREILKNRFERYKYPPAYNATVRIEN
jgi:hypothetical protein